MRSRLVPAAPVIARIDMSRRKLAVAVLHAYALLVPAIPMVRWQDVTFGMLDALFVVSLALVATARRFHFSIYAATLALFVVAAVASSIAVEGEARLAVYLRTLRLVEITMPVFVAMTITMTRCEAHRLFRSFVIGAGFSAVVGLVLFHYQVLLGPVQRFRYPTGQTLYRAGGIFADSSSYGHLLATWWIVAAGLLIVLGGGRRGQSVRAGLFWLITLIGVLGLYASLSRSAALGVLVALGVGFALPKARRWSQQARRVARSGLVAAVPVVVAASIFRERVVYVTSFLWGRLVEGPLSLVFAPERIATVSSGRTENWARSLSYFNDSPIIGIGYKALISVHHIPPDNNFLAVLVETGLLGAAAFLSFLLATIVLLLQRYLRGSPLAWVLLLAWSAQLFMAVAIDVMTFWGTTPALLALTAVVVTLGPTSCSRASGKG